MKVEIRKLLLRDNIALSDLQNAFRTGQFASSGAKFLRKFLATSSDFPEKSTIAPAGALVDTKSLTFLLGGRYWAPAMAQNPNRAIEVEASVIFFRFNMTISIPVILSTNNFIYQCRTSRRCPRSLPPRRHSRNLPQFLNAGVGVYGDNLRRKIGMEGFQGL